MRTKTSFTFFVCRSFKIGFKQGAWAKDDVCITFWMRLDSIFLLWFEALGPIGKPAVGIFNHVWPPTHAPPASEQRLMYKSRV